MWEVVTEGFSAETVGERPGGIRTSLMKLGCGQGWGGLGEDTPGRGSGDCCTFELRNSLWEEVSFLFSHGLVFSGFPGMETLRVCH